MKAAQIGEGARWRTRNEDLATITSREVPSVSPGASLALDETLKTNQKRMAELIQCSLAGPLLEETAVGSRTAVFIITALSHPDKVRSAAAFAAFAGVSPIPAYPVRTIRPGLNRGDDRRLNRALHTAATTPPCRESDTRAHVERRLTARRTLREIRRCIKRHLTRRPYRTLDALHASTTT